MNPMILGQRIKEARLAKKMTQNEVVGTFITRNMLSQIESGTAMPSMKTLAYLAQVLELPLAELLAGTEEAAPEPLSEPTQLLPQNDLQYIRDLYQSEQDTELLAFLSGLSEEDFLFAEKAAYRARSAYRLALAFETQQKLSEALLHAQDAAKWADIGFYANPVLKADALLLLSRLAAELSKMYNSNH
ncbi:MAG: helix-turn-helix domain-containing protein [Lachnospiraceae bacterium]|nr:helix-turn-helix domain-containing protein [Lachnospiraceae bacterium]